MWDGITYIDSTHNPIIYEGMQPARVIVNNAGPSSVLLLGWQSYKGGEEPELHIQMWPGNTRAIGANLVRVALLEHPYYGNSGFAAIGWRIL